MPFVRTIDNIADFFTKAAKNATSFRAHRKIIMNEPADATHTIMVGLPCMHHAPSNWRSASTRQDSLTDMNPLATHTGSLSNVARHRPPSMCGSRLEYPSNRAVRHERRRAERWDSSFPQFAAVYKYICVGSWLGQYSP